MPASSSSRRDDLHLEAERRIGWVAALRGRPLGSPGSFRSFRRQWEEAFDELCERENIVVRFQITLGSVIEKTTGEVFQLRNFDDQKPWMRGSPFRDIRRVYRSPMRYVAESS